MDVWPILRISTVKVSVWPVAVWHQCAAHIASACRAARTALKSAWYATHACLCSRRRSWLCVCPSRLQASMHVNTKQWQYPARASHERSFSKLLHTWMHADVFASAVVNCRCCSRGCCANSQRIKPDLSYLSHSFTTNYWKYDALRQAMLMSAEKIQKIASTQRDRMVVSSCVRGQQRCLSALKLRRECVAATACEPHGALFGWLASHAWVAASGCVPHGPVTTADCCYFCQRSGEFVWLSVVQCIVCRCAVRRDL